MLKCFDTPDLSILDIATFANQHAGKRVYAKIRGFEQSGYMAGYSVDPSAPNHWFFILGNGTGRASFTNTELKSYYPSAIFLFDSGAHPELEKNQVFPIFNEIVEPPITKTPDKYPHKCPRCGDRAFVLALTVECTNQKCPCFVGYRIEMASEPVVATNATIRRHTRMPGES